MKPAHPPGLRHLHSMYRTLNTPVPSLAATQAKSFRSNWLLGDTLWELHMTSRVPGGGVPEDFGIIDG